MTIDHSFRLVLVFCAAGLAIRIVTGAFPQVARDLGVTLCCVTIVLLGYGLAAAAMHKTRL